MKEADADHYNVDSHPNGQRFQMPEVGNFGDEEELYVNGSDVPSGTEADQAVIHDSTCNINGEYSLLISYVTKTYPPSFCRGKSKHALKGLSLGLWKGECFGLLVKQRDIYVFMFN